MKVSSKYTLNEGFANCTEYLNIGKDDMSPARPVISDIYHYIPDFDKAITWVDMVRLYPGDDFTFRGLMKDLVSSHCNNGLIFTQASSVYLISAKSVQELIDNTDDISQDLFECGFCRVLFNRKMGNSYGKSDIFLYMNEDAKEFIEKYSGDDKLIKFTVSKD